MHRISVFTESLLVFVALTLDMLQLILGIFIVGGVLNTFISILYYGTVGVVLYTHGIAIIHPKRTKKFLASVIGEAIPFVNMLPWLTISTVMTLRQLRREMDEQEEREAAEAQAVEEEALLAEQDAFYEEDDLPEAA
jgi:hypothetical protein